MTARISNFSLNSYWPSTKFISESRFSGGLRLAFEWPGTYCGGDCNGEKMLALKNEYSVASDVYDKMSTAFWNRIGIHTFNASRNWR